LKKINKRTLFSLILCLLSCL